MNTKIFKTVLIFIMLGLGFIAYLYKPLMANNESNNVITIKDKGISIIPPKGWLVKKNYPNITLLLEAPDESMLDFKRTIQIMSFADPIYLDEMTADKYEQIIEKKFGSVENIISDYRVNSYVPYKLKDGTPAYLYYASFKVKGVQLMHMHILISSSKRHFIITFTDLEKYFNFEGETSPHLAEAWNSIASIKLNSQGPERLKNSMIFIGSLIGLFLFGVIFYWLIQNTAKKKYEHLSRELEDSPEEMPVVNEDEEWQIPDALEKDEEDDDYFADVS